MMGANEVSTRVSSGGAASAATLVRVAPRGRTVTLRVRSVPETVNRTILIRQNGHFGMCFVFVSDLRHYDQDLN